jgi:phosphatidylserine/phosphatidylglycerophosphate/cardiolipin synthase-like enzyme
VFASDFACEGRTVTNVLRDSKLALTWSNGSTGVQPGDAADEYPANGQYPYFSSNPPQPSPDGPDPGPGTDQGNVRTRTLEVINGAQERLDIYNEEMSDQQTINAIAAAAQRLGPDKVRVVMTGNVNGQNSYAAAYNQMQAAGVTIHLFPNSNNVLYIHAKAIIADGKDAYVGSTNISSPSMNFNRELGVRFTDQAAALALLLATFERDFSDPVAVPWTQQTVAAVPPQSIEASEGQPNTPALMEAPAGSNTTPMPCGPVSLPSPWPPVQPSPTATPAPTATATPAPTGSVG